MTRAALRSTPAPGRKNTFKPLITRTNKSLAEEAMRSIKIPPDQKTADPPETVEPIDAHLKLGLTASVSLPSSHG